jgi:hypothetical protein
MYVNQGQPEERPLDAGFRDVERGLKDYRSSKMVPASTSSMATSVTIEASSSTGHGRCPPGEAGPEDKALAKLSSPSFSWRFEAKLR